MEKDEKGMQVIEGNISQKAWCALNTCHRTHRFHTQIDDLVEMYWLQYPHGADARSKYAQKILVMDKKHHNMFSLLKQADDRQQKSGPENQMKEIVKSYQHLAAVSQPIFFCVAYSSSSRPSPRYPGSGTVYHSYQSPNDEETDLTSLADS